MRQLRVLTIFHDKHWRSGMTDLLEIENFTVLARKNCDYLDLVRDQFRPDIAIAWIYYGDDLYQACVEHLIKRNVPTLFISSHTLTPILHKFRGFQHQIGVLQIPVDTEDLYAAIYELAGDLPDDIVFLNQIYPVQEAE